MVLMNRKFPAKFQGHSYRSVASKWDPTGVDQLYLGMRKDLLRK